MKWTGRQSTGGKSPLSPFRGEGQGAISRSHPYRRLRAGAREKVRLLRFLSIDSLRESERQHHWRWMVGVLVVVCLMWVVLYHLNPSLYTIGAVAVALGIFTGIALGVGRQGIDLLAIRLFVATTAVLADAPAVCSGPADCFHAYEIGVVGIGLFGT